MNRILICLLVATAVSTRPANALAVNVSFQIEQRPQPGGGFQYALETFLGPNKGTGTLTAPNGAVLPSLATATFFDSFSDLGTMFFGNWTATWHPTSGPDVVGMVHVAPFTLPDVQSATPTIVSPPSGAVVPPVFGIDWVSNGTARAYGAMFNAPDLKFSTSGGTTFHRSITVTKFLGPIPATMTADFADVSILPTPSVVSGELTVLQVQFHSHSFVSTYQVVPEPSGVGLVAVEMLAFGYRLRRR